MASEFDIVFARLKEILQKYSGSLTIKAGDNSYSLCGKVGPATLKIWRGEMRQPSMPVAFIEIKKAYVSYHLMGIYANSKLLGGISKELKARMQGKSCFNFKKPDEKVFKELDKLTAKSIESFQKAGFGI